MKPRIWSLLVAAGFLGAIAVPVVADDKPGKDRPGMDKPGHKMTVKGDVAYDGVFNGVRGSELIGADVKNSAGKDLGQIEDVVVDPQSGRVAYAVLQFGGFLGMGDKLFAIPWRSLQIRENDLVTLDIAKEQLEQSQGFNQDKWPNMADVKWATDTHQRYGQRPYWEMDVDVDINDPDMKVDRKAPRTLAICKLSNVIGDDVTNTADNDLGEVNDVVLDTTRGQIAYAVLGIGGFIGIGEDLVAVPWEKLDVNVTQDNETMIRLAMSENELKDGPHFSKDRWPSADDKNYLIQVYTFYDAEPYWREGRRISAADVETP